MIVDPTAYLGTGKRRFALLALTGLIAALCLPPIGWWWVLLLTVPCMIWNWVEAPNAMAAGLRVWCWGTGFYAAGIYWIANALLIEADQFAWLIPFGTLGLGGLLALFTAVTSGLVWEIAVRVGSKPLAKSLWFAIAWVVAEWLRTFVMTGFPWNPLGSVWTEVLPVAQSSALVGIHGLSFLTMAALALLAIVPLMSDRRIRFETVAAVVALSAGVYGWGAIRLSGAVTGSVDGLTFRLVQPAVEQLEKNGRSAREQILARLIDLSRSPGFEKVTHVVWPETAAPFPLASDETHRQLTALAVPKGGLLLSGSVRLVDQGDDKWQFFNSLMAMNDQGQIVGSYDKSHLVPFGEYVPLRRILPLPHAVAAGGDFSSGPGPRTLDLPGLPPMGPLICYESIFPQEIIDKDGQRPQFLLVVTNDGWFGNSTGPYQHLAAAQARAIEQGLPILRSANTGISASIDSYGRVVESLALTKRGIIDVTLPRTLLHKTVYARFGDLTLLLLLLTAAIVALVFRFRD